MARLKQFHIKWCDAWHKYNEGFLSELVIGDNKIQIDFLVNNTVYTIDISQTEDEFIEIVEKCQIHNLNNNSYVFWMEDGYNWELHIVYDNVDICSTGRNAYPNEIVVFMTLLHEKYDIPKSRIEEIVLGINSKYIMNGVKKEPLDRQARMYIY